MSEQGQRAVLLHLPRNKPIDIEFENITYAVPQGRKGKKQVLKGVSGKFLSGELTAVMGPSGAGKSSLLNILTGFQTSGMGGSIKSSGNQHKEGSNQYKKESCYILQDDRLAPLFTVSEIMTMATDLKLGYSLSEKAKQLVIDDVLDTLGLSACRDTRCEKLSGGQKKRLSIALELVDNPPIMFLDEPTTGLDSSSSSQCISMLKALARGGRTIVCTIHQPSATIYEMFDHVYVLAEGKCIYQGASTNTVPYLSSVGLQCPQYHNPADYLLEVANAEYGCFTDQLSQAALETNWRKVLKSPKLDIVQETNGYNGFTTVAKTMVLIQPPSEWVKFWVLLNRSILQLYRDWTVTHLKLLVHALVGVILGLLYLNTGGDGSRTISNVGYMMVTAVYLCYTSMMPAVLKFPSELPILKKERFNNWYCLKTYYAAYMVAGIPTQVLFCAVYTSISYFMSAQPQDWTRFGMFLGTCILITLTSEGMGLVLGTTVNPINGTFLGAILTAVMLVVAGFLILFNHMPGYMYLISYFSYLRYGLQGLIVSIYGDHREPLPCPDSILYCHYRVPKVLLDEFGISADSFWMNAIVLSIIFVCFRFTAYCTLKRSLRCG